MMSSAPKGGWISYLFLTGAIVFEVSGTTCMKLSEGFHHIAPAIVMVPLYMLCFGCLTLAIRKIDVSVAYAVWAGVGTTLITLVGIFWFDDPATLLKIFSIGLIVIGVMGLNLQAEHT
jgi:small multidrug resistance pump